MCAATSAGDPGRSSEWSIAAYDCFMTMCAAAGLLEWRDGRYANAPDVQRFLVGGESRYAGAWLQFLRPEWEKWGKLNRVAAHGRAGADHPTFGSRDDGRAS